MTDMFEAKNVKPMLIGESQEAFDSPDFIYELKMDGERCIAYLDPLIGTVLRNKRNMEMLGKVPELTKIHKQVNARCILDGELIVAVNGEPNFYEILRRTVTSDKFKIQLQSSRYPASFVAFDILYHEGQEVTSWPVMDRKALLERVVTENERLVLSRYVEGHGVDLFNLAASRGMEGIVAKRKDSRYYQDKCTKDWIKCKNLQDDDFAVCGYIPKGERAGSVILGQYEGDDLTYKGHVTHGVSPNDYRILAGHRRADAPHFDPVVTGNTAAVWLEPTLVCTVRYMEMLQTGFMRQPVFKGFRMDKDALECVGQHAAGAMGDA